MSTSRRSRSSKNGTNGSFTTATDQSCNQASSSPTSFAGSRSTSPPSKATPKPRADSCCSCLGFRLALYS